MLCSVQSKGHGILNFMFHCGLKSPVRDLPSILLFNHSCVTWALLFYLTTSLEQTSSLCLKRITILHSRASRYTTHWSSWTPHGSHAATHAHNIFETVAWRTFSQKTEFPAQLLKQNPYIGANVWNSFGMLSTGDDIQFRKQCTGLQKTCTE